MAARVRDLLGATESGPERPDAGLPAPTRSGWRQLTRRLRSLPVRVDPGRRTALAVGVAVLVAALLTGAWVMAQRPSAVPVPAGAASIPASATPVGTHVPQPSPSAGGSSGAAGVPASSAGLVVVDVAGKVRRPGIYRLRNGARVDDAVRAAGGSLAGVDLSSLNLAARVVDGQQILVGSPAGAGGGLPATSGAPGASGAVPGAGSQGGTAPVNLNIASLEQLQTLPGVGPVLAQRVLDWRTEHGSFTRVDQLDDVSGIGAVKFAALRSLVTV